MSRAAHRVNKARERLRPRRSAIQRKHRYPGNIPMSLSVPRSLVVLIRPKPRPPLSTAVVKYGGIQLNRPHHANSPNTLSRSKTIVGLRRAGEKISEKGAFS